MMVRLITMIQVAFYIQDTCSSALGKWHITILQGYNVMHTICFKVYTLDPYLD